ncbi:hypothetical protein NHQ30_001080 [Ciborinia camelliae]|nr:hypothetical protein NHQ30_001080 [Ciborinia camelliae]
MFERPKSPRDRYPSERTIRVDAMPPPYRYPTYVVEPAFVPTSPYYENMYHIQERERERLRLEHESERALERGRRPSCSDLFHNIDVIQRLGERFKGLDATFSHSSSSHSHAGISNPPSSTPSNSNAGISNSNTNTNTNTNTSTQANPSSANTTALAARIKELEKEKEMAREKEIERLNGGLNGVRGDIQGLQMRSEREEGRREGRMEGMGIQMMGCGHAQMFDGTWVNTSGELGRRSSQHRVPDLEAENTRRRIEVLEQQRARDVDGELLLRKMDERLVEERLDRMVDAERRREMTAARERDCERTFRMNRLEDRVEGRVERVEDRVDRMVEREGGRVGEGERERERRDGSLVRRERYARPRIMRERERDWEYGYENGSGYGGLRYRGYV